MSSGGGCPGNTTPSAFAHAPVPKMVSPQTGNVAALAWAAGVTNKFLYDGWNLVAELNGTNGLVRSYLWGSDLSGGDAAGGVGGLLAVQTHGATPGTNFVAMDGNGNVAALINATDGTVTATYEYGPFGELLRVEGPMAKGNPFRFSTKYQDEESDLVYYGLRYYRADTSRWLNRDPIGEDGGLNLYGFVGNDAVNQVDRLGMISSLNFVTPAQMAWLLGSGAAFDAGVSIGMQRLTRDRCKDEWLDWGQVGKDVGTGAGINLATLGLARIAKLRQAAKLARALDEAEELRALGQYDELAEMVARYGDDFGDTLANYKRAKAAATGFNAAADAGRLGAGVAEGRLFRSAVSGEAMDSGTFARIQTAFERKPGRSMFSDVNSERFLGPNLLREGETLSENVVMLRMNPSSASVYEELIHTAQLRRGMSPANGGWIDMEIEAIQKVIKFADSYKIPAADTAENVRRLRYYQSLKK